MNLFLDKFKLNNYQIYIFIFILIVILRLPFFFTDVFDWDESTYILQGQWIVDGNLSYLNRTAVKPPLLYYLYSSFVYFSFGEIFLIRFYGSFLLLINFIYLNKIFRECFNKNFDIILITSFIFSSTYIIKDSNALFSENFAVTFLLISLYYLLNLKRNTDFFFLGLFLSCACLTRLNLGILPIIIFIYLLFRFKSDTKDKIIKLSIYFFGGISLAFIVLLPYIITNNIIPVWNSTIVSGYLMAQNGPYSTFGTIYSLLFQKSDLFDLFKLESIFRLIFWISSFIGFLILIFDYKNEKNFKIIIFFITIFFSIILGGRSSPHYLILINSICSLFVAFVFINIKQNFYCIRIYLLSLLMCFFVSLFQYIEIIKNYKINQTFYNGLGFQIASYIKSKEKNNYNIYIYKNHIAYWFLDKYPPTDITHPSDINKEYLFVGWNKKNSNKKIEMKKIMNTRPTYLVLNNDISTFVKNFFPMSSIEYKETISNYTLDKKIDYMYIYIIK